MAACVVTARKGLAQNAGSTWQVIYSRGPQYSSSGEAVRAAMVTGHFDARLCFLGCVSYPVVSTVASYTDELTVRRRLGPSSYVSVMRAHAPLAAVDGYSPSGGGFGVFVNIQQVTDIYAATYGIRDDDRGRLGVGPSISRVLVTTGGTPTPNEQRATVPGIVFETAWSRAFFRYFQYEIQGRYRVIAPVHADEVPIMSYASLSTPVASLAGSRTPRLRRGRRTSPWLF